MPFNRNNAARSAWLILFLVNVGSPLVRAQLVGDDLQFPYQAIVLTDRAEVRSGPGKVHYSTGVLKQGSTVEVYRHDPGGWCAIRPPNSSFSLIPAGSLEIVNDGIGEISEEGTQAWVGTELGPVDQPLWQIKLRAGETVEVLGEANWPDPAGHSTVWYQIAPPAGEFRWIHVADLQLPPSRNDLNRANVNQGMGAVRNAIGSDGPQNSSSLNSSNSYVQPANYQTNQLELNAPQSSSVSTLNQGWRQASRPIDKSATAAENNNPRATVESYVALPAADFANVGSGSQPQASWSNERLASTRVDPRFDLEQLAPPPVSKSLAADPPALPLGGYVGSQPLTLKLTELELKLNQEMIKEPNQWRLIDLQTSTENIVETTADPVEQLQAQRLLAKLENCRKIRSDYLNAFQINGGSREEGAVGTGLTDKEFSLDTIYDAHGWLNETFPVGGTKRSAYVLQDDNGKITHHISPSPGMNLSSYLKTKVGIIGRRGFHTKLKLDHVTAERVIQLKSR